MADANGNPPAPPIEADRPPVLPALAPGPARDGRDNQPPAELDGTGSSYLTSVRLDDRFAHQPIARNEPIIQIALNFMHLRLRVFNLLFAVFKDWEALRSRINADRTRVDNNIRDGCDHLATAFIYLLYSYLRRKTGRFLPSRYTLYRNRCFFDEKTQIPAGLTYLVQQFGVTPPVEAFGNNRFIHVWDGEHADTYGIANTVPAFDADVLHGFISTLNHCGVTLNSVDSRAPARTVWDSLLILDLDASGITAETVFPKQEYDLPRDVFLAFGLLGPSDGNNRPLQAYGPRIGAANGATRDAMRADTQADNRYCPRPGEAKTVTAAADEASTVNGSTAIGHVQNVHPTGVINRETGRNAGPPVVINYEYHALVYGRGPVTSTMTIMSVARGLSDYEVDGYYRNLFRKGA